jgi:hypothetical protein
MCCFYVLFAWLMNSNLGVGISGWHKYFAPFGETREVKAEEIWVLAMKKLGFGNSDFGQTEISITVGRIFI